MSRVDSFSRILERYIMAVRTSSRSVTSRLRKRVVSWIHCVISSNSSLACRCRFSAYCDFHAWHSSLSAIFMGAVSSERAPMECLAGICAISASYVTYFLSSNSKSSSVGSFAMNSLYAPALSSCQRKLYLVNVSRYSYTCRLAPSTAPVSSNTTRTISRSFEMTSYTEVRPEPIWTSQSHTLSAFEQPRTVREQRLMASWISLRGGFITMFGIWSSTLTSKNGLSFSRKPPVCTREPTRRLIASSETCVQSSTAWYICREK
mmetsp:Transcript_2375/g.7930  ORF Transcript_2375/g.7930 Transcript_2375/m.7930 type:complete len:262 (+) Transcript_2375:4616-5401(+)